jgi:hypothetical protein
VLHDVVESVSPPPDKKPQHLKERTRTGKKGRGTWQMNATESRKGFEFLARGWISTAPRRWFSPILAQPSG